MCPGYQLIGCSGILINNGFLPFSEKISTLYYPMNNIASSEHRRKKTAESFRFPPQEKGLVNG
jgi:hypothetical protein